MALHAASSTEVISAASPAAEPVMADGQDVPETSASLVENELKHARSEDRASSPASTSAPQ